MVLWRQIWSMRWKITVWFIPSFKYGDFEGERNGRYFTDFTEDTFEKFIKVIQELTIEEEWITSDVRPGRVEEKWLNLILRKIQK